MTERPDPRAVEEAEAAAAEAGRIGGTPTRQVEGDLPQDPGAKAVYEGGGGEAEGFEMAEQELREHAEHGPASPPAGAKAVRQEADRGVEERDRASYGEPDEEDVHELVRDPREGPDDPGAGPGLAQTR